MNSSFLFLVMNGKAKDASMKRYSVILTGLLVVTLAVSGCTPKPEEQKMKDADRKAFLSSCLSRCESTALSQVGSADKEFLKSYCTENCTCTADKVSKELSMADLVDKSPKVAAATSKKLNDIVQQCSDDFTAKQAEKTAAAAKSPAKADAAKTDAKPAEAAKPEAKAEEKAAAPAKH